MSRARSGAIAVAIAVGSVLAFSHGTRAPGPAVSACRAASLPVSTSDLVDVGATRADLADVMHRTHHAFVELDGALVGGDATYAVSVRGRDIEVRPDLESATPLAATDIAPLVLHTRAFGREEADPAQDGLFVRDDDGHLVAEMGAGAAEHLHNTEGGIEQSWSLAARPPGSGDLVARISVTGERLVATTESGLHFADPESGFGLRYSHARWVDADGIETRVPVAFEDGDIVARVPADLVERSKYPAMLDPTVSAEIDVDAPLYGAAPGAQDTPAVAHSGATNAEFLAACLGRVLMAEHQVMSFGEKS